MACAANILVVDDEESMRIACAQTLMEEGYRVQEAENGQRGLAMTERESFDLVLLDLKMPGISGMEVLRHIKEEDPSSVVIVITGYFLAKSSLHDGRSSLRISPEAMRFLRQYDWPGNIRQLKNVLECATVTCKGTVITMADLALNSPGLQAEPGDQAPDGALAESEKREIVKALRQFDGHRSKAAEHLGINRKTLREKMRKYGLDQ